MADQANRLFVGRQEERGRLQHFLGQALGGRGQVVFVMGEAGSGKTALVQAFAEEADGHSDSLVVAMGSCSAHSEIADPYLPFREVLGVLSGLEDQASEAPNKNVTRLRKLAGRTAQVLVEVGPDLVGSIIPGAALLAKIGKVVAQKVGWLDKLEKLVQAKHPSGVPQAAMEQGRIFEQYANVLKTLAKEQPLLIILDDLHWADEASIGLLFHLSRRIEQSSILLVGTYRPDELAASQRHPLEKVLNEIKRQAGDVWIDLDQAQEAHKRALVDQLLDSEPNELGEGFRQALYRHTEGNPLFTTELLRTLQARGDLRQNAQGRWVEGPALDWGSLPARIEGVVEERLGRLEESQRELLRTASVEGESFIAEALAQVQQTPLRQLLKELSQNLEKHHRLVRERGELRVGQARLSGYGFAHTLFQGYLYRQLGAGERRLLHGELAQALAQLYAGHTQEICAQLAWHYDQAGQAPQAAQHLIMAAELANQQGAPREAKRFADRAIELLAEADELYWRALIARHTALLRLSDSPALRAGSEDLIAIAQRSENPQKRAEAHYRKLLYANFSGNGKAIQAAAEEAIQAARQAANLALEARGLQFKMLAQVRLGEVAAAQQTAQVALERAQQCGDSSVLANVLNALAVISDEAGEPQKAVDFNTQALSLARQESIRVLEARILVNLGNGYRSLGLYDLAQTTLEQALEANTAIGARRERAYVLVSLGFMHLANTRPDQAQPLLAEALAESSQIGDEYLRAWCYKALGDVAEQMQDLPLAFQHFERARQQFEALNLEKTATEPIAGLARLSLAQGQLEPAQGYALQLWESLKRYGMDSLVLETHLACADVFTAVANLEDARTVIEGGYRGLIDRAYRIGDPSWRKAFLENVPENRQMLHYWQKVHAG